MSLWVESLSTHILFGLFSYTIVLLWEEHYQGDYFHFVITSKMMKNGTDMNPIWTVSKTVLMSFLIYINIAFKMLILTVNIYFISVFERRYTFQHCAHSLNWALMHNRLFAYTKLVLASVTGISSTFQGNIHYHAYLSSSNGYKSVLLALGNRTFLWKTL